MLLRKRINLFHAIKFSWKILVFSFLASGLAYLSNTFLTQHHLFIPGALIGLMGTALAVILGFRNSAAYERWWEARRVWGNILNESRTFTRQVITILDEDDVSPELWNESINIVHRHISWSKALKLQLRGISDSEIWEKEVYQGLSETDIVFLKNKTNKATQIMMLQGRAIKSINASQTMDNFSYIQMDDTLTRLTDMQGASERIKSTPLPKPYDYYTLAFLYLFVFLLPFGIVHELDTSSQQILLFPIAMAVSWLFYQIYVLGRAMTNPFENLPTDVALDAICLTIEIDLKEVIGDLDIPKPAVPVNNVLM